MKNKITKIKEVEVIKNKVPKLQVIEKDEVMLNGKKLKKGKDYIIIGNGSVILSKEIAETTRNKKNIIYTSYVYREVKSENVKK